MEELNRKMQEFINRNGDKNAIKEKENTIYKIRKIGDKVVELIDQEEPDLAGILGIVGEELIFIDKTHNAFDRSGSIEPLINLAVQFCFLFRDRDIFAGSRYDYRLW